ncbi:MAG: Crp/Fnr family transcriptional regulator [Flavobacteriales bacterium]|nr:Crp/Fnr family transcriptional regulator [Flavobacteriales bacterium]
MLLTFLEKQNILNKSSIHILVQEWNGQKKINRKDFITKSGNKEHRLYFIEKGIVRLYVEETEVTPEVNIGFGYQNSIITSFSAFVSNEPSKLSIQALTDCEVNQISKPILFHLIDSNKDISNWYRSIVEKTLAGHINRQIELLTLSPKQRYEVFLKRSGNLVNSIPIKHIASYLKMKPETLSRIRKQIS